MNTLITRNPFADFDNLFRSMERNLESAWRGSSQNVVPMDVFEKGDAFFIRAFLPGVQEEDVNLSIEKDVVTLKGNIRRDYYEEGTKVYLQETPYGTFTRSVRLPENSQIDKAEAQFDRGVLTIRIPKAEKVSTTRSIPIRSGNAQPKALEAGESEPSQPVASENA